MGETPSLNEGLIRVWLGYLLASRGESIVGRVEVTGETPGGAARSWRRQGWVHRLQGGNLYVGCGSEW